MKRKIFHLPSAVKKRREEELERQDQALVKHIAEKAEHGTSILTDATNGSIGMLHIIHRLTEITKEILDGIPWLMTISLIFSSLIRIVEAFINEKQSTSTRGVKILTAVAALGLAITSLVLLPLLPFLLAASIGVDVMWAMWDMAEAMHKTRAIEHQLKEKRQLLIKNENVSIKDEKEIIKLKNQISTLEKEYRQSIFESAGKTQHFVLNLTSLAGAIIFITVPVIGQVIGAAILMATAGYGIIDKFGLNPLRYLAKTTFDYFFFKGKEKKETIKQDTLTPTPKPIAKITETPTPKPKETSKPVKAPVNFPDKNKLEIRASTGMTLFTAKRSSEIKPSKKRDHLTHIRYSI